MAIRLDFKVANRSIHDEHAFTTMSAESLHYDCLLGDILFFVDKVDFSACWSWIPILDFSLVFFELVRDLPNSQSAMFAFTESDATISLNLVDGKVRIATSYVSESAVVEYESLYAELLSLVSRAIHELSTEHPLIMQNPYFIEISSRVTRTTAFDLLTN